jgi:uncharacterized metal-binding protein YceD (DUF177 family)
MCFLMTHPIAARSTSANIQWRQWRPCGMRRSMRCGAASCRSRKRRSQPARRRHREFRTFVHPVPARDIPPGGRRFTIEAGETERLRLAEALDIQAVASLAAELDVHPVASRGFTVRGRLNASVVQTDVVTLEPVTLDVVEDVDVTLMPAEAAGAKSRRTEVLVDVAEEDGPDLFHNGRIDLGVIVTEHLALGLDPYPRAPGTDFPGHVESDEAEDPSPFAALAALRKSEE